MRCQYCHNPDTWQINKGDQKEPEELIALYEKNRPFYATGGITVTGGEPLLQIDFLLELFRLAKERGIHTCIDTSGITYHPGESSYNRKLNELMEHTDLVMLDIKHTDPEKHRILTGQDNSGIFSFAEYLAEKRIPVWIRHVIVPGITDEPQHLRKLGRFVGRFSNLKALDVLPYHTMGISKYRELGITYPLEGVDPLPKEKAVEARKIILEGIREIRHQKN